MCLHQFPKLANRLCYKHSMRVELTLRFNDAKMIRKRAWTLARFYRTGRFTVQEVNSARNQIVLTFRHR